MKYLNLEADSVYGYLIWVIRFEFEKGSKKIERPAAIDIPLSGGHLGSL